MIVYADASFISIEPDTNCHGVAWWLWLYQASVTTIFKSHTVYPKKYARGFAVLCFVVVMQSFIMNSHEVFIHIHQGCFAGTGAIVRLPQCQWSKPDGYGKISQCITTTQHSKAKTVCICLGIYCIQSPRNHIIQDERPMMLLSLTLWMFKTTSVTHTDTHLLTHNVTPFDFTIS